MVNFLYECKGGSVESGTFLNRLDFVTIVNNLNSRRNITLSLAPNRSSSVYPGLLHTYIPAAQRRSHFSIIFKCGAIPHIHTYTYISLSLFTLIHYMGCVSAENSDICHPIFCIICHSSFVSFATPYLYHLPPHFCIICHTILKN